MSATTTALVPVAKIELPTSAPRAARAVFRLLKRLAVGTLDVQLPDGGVAVFGSGHEPRCAIRLRDWQVCSAALRSGDIGFAETYIEGRWSTPDLAALLTLFVANRDAIEQVVYGRWWGSLAHRLRHLLNRNSRCGSRRNIHAHYDIGNAFYRLWLDGTMNYSSAWFGGDTTRPMEQAQAAKVQRALAECGIRPGGRLLEIGCGWGALAEAAVRDLGAQVTGITLSTEQLDWARERLMRQGLSADLRLQDWRELDQSQEGPYDAIASIEMFEAVGRAYWDRFFDKLHALLAPGGKVCLQTITIDDALFERYARSTDFIQQYIFPGGMLPSPSIVRALAARHGFTVRAELAFGADYAETLRRWRASFLANEAALAQQGFDARFMRTWEFYLAYCEAAFERGNTDVMQFTLQREA